MATIEKIEFDYAGFDTLRKSDEVMAFVEEIATERAATSDLNVKLLKKRGSVRVQAADQQTAKENSRKNRLVKAYKR